ncbi:MAG: imidazoleglycerol-phosphate dehydratase HisB [Clostridia bacterium]|nr:imidazoleglycerol-phosphate dehydratase HisB [Clostridia bacterium]
MAENTVKIDRKTAETDISLSFTLYGEGKHEISTGCGFLDHMLTLFAVHGGFDLAVKCVGDTYVDYHHTAEDIGICLGDAFARALDVRGIARYGDITLPMDETLVLAAVDVSGRQVLAFDLGAMAEKVGDFDTELVKEFFTAFVRRSGITLHIKLFYGENTHHKIEAAFKATARAIAKAVKKDGTDRVPSSKGVI